MERFFVSQGPDSYVLAHWLVCLDPWLGAGYARVEPDCAMNAAFEALSGLSPQQLRDVWRRLIGEPGTREVTSFTLLDELVYRGFSRPGGVVVLERLIDRSTVLYTLPDAPAPQARTQADHFVVVEAVDAKGQPVAEVALELLIAGGEVRTARTGSDGLARLERIQAGTVVIRVLNLEGHRWRPVEGTPSVQSSAHRHNVHEVRRGENLTRIARAHGVESWRTLWDDPANDALRKRRTDPNVIHPGDQVHVPGMAIHEITREVDTTHRIEVDPRRAVVAVLNTHLLSALGSVGVHWLGDAATLAATGALYRDATSSTLRLHDVPERAALALVPPNVA